MLMPSGMVVQMEHFEDVLRVEATRAQTGT